MFSVFVATLLLKPTYVDDVFVFLWVGDANFGCLDNGSTDLTTLSFLLACNEACVGAL